MPPRLQSQPPVPATSLSARAATRAAAPAWLPLALLVALAALLRLPTLDVQSLWLDEAMTAELVRGDLGDVLARLAEEGDASALQALDGVVDELAREVAELKAQTTTGRF